MVTSPSSQLSVRYEFEAFCKTVARGERKSYFRWLKRRKKRPANFSDIPDAVVERVCADDADPDSVLVFHAHGNPVPIRNVDLADALLTLSPQKVTILLLAFSLGFSDREIGVMLGMSRSKVQRDKKELLSELRKKMKG